MDQTDYEIKIISEPIMLDELIKCMIAGPFSDMVKAVVDIDKRIIGIGSDMHVDIEQLLLEQDSKQKNLWGINVWPEETDEQYIEFDSMINIRPRDNNRSRGVDSVEIQKNIKEIVNELIKK